MFLTDDERRILNGGQGEIAQRCMKYLVDYGEAAGAERLVNLDGTVDLHPGGGGNWVPAYQVTLKEMAELARKGEQFKVPTFADKVTGFIVHGWAKTGLSNSDPAYHNRFLAELQPLIDMGMVPTLSCAHYLDSSFWPSVGQHCAWVESSAVPWANAVLGARTNFDGGFHTAYLGKAPAYDMHLTEKRAATVLVRCEADLKSDMDYDLFGWAVGEALGLKVPALTGIDRPTTSQLVKMNSALNTGGQVRMYHIPGMTPEAPTLEAAFQGKEPRETISITRRDLRRVYDLLNYGSRDDVDFVSLGCPHYNLEQLRKVAGLLGGRKCKVRLWVMCTPGAYPLAELAGYKKTIEDAGAMLLSGACPGIVRGRVMPGDECPDVAALDAAKQDYYLTGHCHPHKVQVRYGTMEDCVDAAVTGKWRGEWR